MRRNLPELFSHSLRGARPCISFLGSVIPYAAVRYGRPRLVGFRASVYIRSAKLVEESYRTYLVVLRPRADPNCPEKLFASFLRQNAFKVFDSLAELIDMSKVFLRSGSSLFPFVEKNYECAILRFI